MNPLLIPIFDNNVDVIAQILAEISSQSTINPKFTPAFEQTIVNDFLNFQVTNIGADPSGTNITLPAYPMNEFYKNAPGITTLSQLLTNSQFNDAYLSTNGQNIFDSLTVNKGVMAANVIITTGRPYNPNDIIREVKIMVSVVIIGILN